MFDKLLALASVTAVATLGLASAVGGCSSSDPVGPASSADAGSTRDAKPNTPPETDEDPPEEACGPKGDNQTMATLDAAFGWKPPPARQSACTAADIDAMKKVQQISSYRDFIATTSASCQACALSTKDSPSWGPIVMNDSSSKEGFVNFGACFAALESPACGKALQYLEFCAGAACTGCADAERAECVQNALQSQCAEPYAEFQAECKDPNLNSTCGQLIAGIEYLCSYEAPDGGAPDGG